MPGDGESAADGRPDATSRADVERLARQYTEAGRPFARVTVVRREPPVSAAVGDRALVTDDGDLVGWVGGVECAQSIVVREATEAMAADEPRLIGLAPDPETIDRQGVESYPMTCHSGGVLELFVEPVTAPARLVVVGDTPVARVLVRLAAELPYDVTVVPGPDATPDDHPDADAVLAGDDAATLAEAVEGADAMVVASMGAIDDVGVEAGIRAAVPYLGLVASGPRAEALYGTVADRLDRDRAAVAAAVTCPAGLDIDAGRPAEIAVSILAELVERGPRVGGSTDGATSPAPAGGSTRAAEAAVDGEQSPRAAGDGSDGSTPAADDGRSTEAAGDGGDESTRTTAADAGTAVDPVCGMDVVVGEAAATVDHGGETYHFCGEGCADAFATEPGRYLGGEVG